MPQVKASLEIVKDRWESSKRLRHMYDLHWEKGIRKAAGQMWLRWDPASESWRPAVNRRDFKMRRTNLIRRDMRVLAANMLVNFPHPTARPAAGPGSLEEKRQGAEYATGLFQQWWEDHDWDGLLKQITNSLLWVGNAYVRATWNTQDAKRTIERPLAPVPTQEMVDSPETYCPNCAQSFQGQHQTCPACGMMVTPENVRMPPTPQTVMKPPMGPDGQPQMETTPLGDVSFEFIPFHEIYAPRRATSLANAGYLYRLRWQAPEWIQQVTGSKEPVQATRIDTDNLFDWKINTITGDPDQFEVLEEEHSQVEDLAPFLEYWEQPTTKNSKGLHLVFNGLDC